MPDKTPDRGYRGASDPVTRAWAWVGVNLVDHGLIRMGWTNHFEVAPGVWRANQPSPARLVWLHRQGFRSILNLRGAGLHPSYLFERDACERLGLHLESFKMSAKKLPAPDRLIALLDLLRHLPRPMLIHCKSGADRTGLVAAIHLLTVEGRPLDEARCQLSWKYLHRSTGPTGVLDHLLTTYERAGAARGLAFADWVAQDYDPARIAAEWRALGMGRRQGKA